MRSLTFEERFFANSDEWKYFLSQAGIKDDFADKYIDSVTIYIDTDDTEVEYQDI